MLTKQMPQDAPFNPPDPFPGRDLVFSLIREHLALQHQTADQQDVKAVGMLAGGTTMVGFAFVVQPHPIGNCSPLIPIWLHHWPILMKLALPYMPFLFCYMFSMIFILQAFRVRGYWSLPDPVHALKNMNKTEQDIKYTLNQAMAHYSKENEVILDKKAFWIQWGGRLLIGEVITLVLLLLYHTIC